MRVEKRGGSKERAVMIGMIVDVAVLSRIASKWEPDLFKSRWANLVGGWCVKYYEKYKKAPGANIEKLFEQWSYKSRDKETIAIVDKFLISLSDEYEVAKEASNSDYVIDLAAELFNESKVRQLSDSLQELADEGEIEKAAELINKFGRVEMGAGAGIDVLRDMDAIRRAFESKGEPLVRFKGALGNFLGDVFERDSLVAFMGPEKRGKSYWLQHVAWTAMEQRKKVAFFEVGDMSEAQIMLRFMIRAARRPLRATQGNKFERFNKPIKYPTFIEHLPDEPMATVDFKEIEYKKPLLWNTAYKACQEIIVKKTRTNDALLKLSCHPNSTISVRGIDSILSTWERQSNWTPDIVVVDYADILAPPVGHVESRDQINATWKALRALSQARHCCVVTATQTDAASYKAETIGRSNFSEDKRKFAHVTAMLGLSQIEEEKRNGLQRLNFVQYRESEFIESQCVHVAGCLSIANPAIKSTF